MTVRELYTKLSTAIEQGFGEQEVCIFPDGEDEPYCIMGTGIITDKDVAEFPNLADYINDFVIDF